MISAGMISALSSDVGEGGQSSHFQKCALPTILWNSQRPVYIPSLLLNLGHGAVKHIKCVSQRQNNQAEFGFYCPLLRDTLPKIKLVNITKKRL